MIIDRWNALPEYDEKDKGDTLEDLSDDPRLLQMERDLNLDGEGSVRERLFSIVDEIENRPDNSGG